MKKSSLFLLSMLCTSSALAEPPDGNVKDAASALVNKQVIAVLKKSEAKRAKFSRSSPPKARRVRVLDDVALTDARGQRFVRFEIDAQYRWSEEGQWEENERDGCVYVDLQKVMVGWGGEGYMTAKDMLSGEGEQEEGACVAAPAAAEPQPFPAAAT